MSSASLPQELLNVIVDFVAYDMQESLKAMSLASRCFLERCQQHLFRNLSFTERPGNPGEGEMKRALVILNCNPALFRHCRYLRVAALSPSMPTVENDLRRILGHLTRLRGLSIGLDMTTEKWIQEGLFGHTLTHVHIHFDVNVPLNILYTLSHLRELRLVSSAWDLAHQPEIDAQRIPWKLKSLEYRPFTPCHPRLLLLAGPSSPVYAELSHIRLVVATREHQRFAWSTILPACQRAPLKTMQLTYMPTSSRMFMLTHLMSMD